MKYTGVLMLLAAALAEAPAQPGLLLQEFIFDKAPHASCHAVTIVETRAGLVAAWFGGTREGNVDVGIWMARHSDGKWSEPVEAFNGIQYVDGSGKTHRHPCWNPVLCRPREGPLLLFYKVGPSPSTWWGMRTESSDDGKTWSVPGRLPEGILASVKNQPLQLPDGSLLCPSSTEHDGWRVHFERTADLGRTWTRLGPINDGKELGIIQPCLLTHPEGRLQALCRTRALGRITETWSDDGGMTWSKPAATSLPNPNSGIDAVTLKDGRHLLVYNHTPKGRTPLNVAVSSDGKQWHAALTLEQEPGEYSYPQVIQTRDGLVHVAYTWKRQRIKHVVLDPAQLRVRPIVEGRWPE
jgi:predicted neuraminidase